MKRIYTVCMVVLSMAAFFSCGNKSQKTPPQKEINPIWGMWLQKSPATDVKQEIMFNEDSTGFVFVADTLQYCLTWSLNERLEVKYKYPSGGDVAGCESIYNVALNGDTLTLEPRESADSSSETRRYLRVRM